MPGTLRGCDDTVRASGSWLTAADAYETGALYGVARRARVRGRRRWVRRLELSEMGNLELNRGRRRRRVVTGPARERLPY